MSNKGGQKWPVKKEKIEKDIKLEGLLVDIQSDICNLSHILRDYIYMDAGYVEYIVLKKRSPEEFYVDFNNGAKAISLILDDILKLLPPKTPDDNTLIMNLLDENATGDFLWFHYHFVVIKQVLDIYIERVNRWQSANEKYEGLSYLEGEAIFLYEMCFDMSSFIYDFYIFKAWEYEVYKENNQIDYNSNPFIRSREIPRMCKSRKAYSRNLLDSCEGVLCRSFYKNDVNVIPIMTSILRLMIELRFEEFFGIQVICKDESHSKVARVVGSKYFCLEDLDRYTVFPVPLDAIKRIYGWASEFVHRGVSDYYWIIFYVKQYLLEFILSDAYMEENYYSDLKSRIAKVFGVTENSIMWRNTPMNLRLVTLERLTEIRKEIKNKGFKKFWLLEQKKEDMELEKITI